MSTDTTFVNERRLAIADTGLGPAPTSVLPLRLRMQAGADGATAHGVLTRAPQ